MSEFINEPLKEYIDKLSSASSTPGGGNAIAVVNSLAAGLLLMSLRIVILKKEPDNSEIQKLELLLIDIQKKSISLAEEDTLRFKQVMSCWKDGGVKLHKALLSSAKVSLDISKVSVGLIDLIGMQDLERFNNIITDVAIAIEFARSCFVGGIYNFLINVKSLDVDLYSELKTEKEKLENKFNIGYQNTLKKVKSMI